jgi:hypothetical protein
MYGTAIHDRAEKALNNLSNDAWKLLGIKFPEELKIITEERNEIEIENYIISGKFDILAKYRSDTYTLMDIKTLSVWAMMIDPAKKKEEFIKQLSIYKYLNQDKNISDRAEILLLFTDWSKVDSIAKKNQGYPQSRLASVDIQLWDSSKTHDYLVSKVKALVNGLERYMSSGDTGYKCSEEERWFRKGGFAFYGKETAKRATKVCETLEEAQALKLKAKDVTAYIEPRKGESVRCKYCSVTAFCEFYQKENEDE